MTGGFDRDELVAAFADLFAEAFDVEGMSMTAKASLHAAAWSQLLSTRVSSMSDRNAHISESRLCRTCCSGFGDGCDGDFHAGDADR